MYPKVKLVEIMKQFTFVINIYNTFVYICYNNLHIYEWVSTVLTNFYIFKDYKCL